MVIDESRKTNPPLFAGSEPTEDEKEEVLEKLRAVPEFANVDDHTLGRFAQVS